MALDASKLMQVRHLLAELRRVRRKFTRLHTSKNPPGNSPRGSKTEMTGHSWNGHVRNSVDRLTINLPGKAGSVSADQFVVDVVATAESSAATTPMITPARITTPPTTTAPAGIAPAAKIGSAPACETPPASGVAAASSSVSVVWLPFHRLPVDERIRHP